MALAAPLEGTRTVRASSTWAGSAVTRRGGGAASLTHRAPDGGGSVNSGLEAQARGREEDGQHSK